MIAYHPPLREMTFVLRELLDGAALLQASGHAPDVIDAILDEAATMATDVLLPLNMRADEQGCRWERGAVRTPDGFREAYRRFVAAGWTGFTAEPAHGGQGVPLIVNTVVEEMLFSSCMSFAMYPGLTRGACTALELHGSAELKALYIPKLVAGTWTGTMCLTESQCGSDLGLIRTRAVPAADGSYRVAGTKIFITAGEHDLAENIVHLVLARTPGAPPGTRGISLFVVPKLLPAVDGTPGAGNGVHCTSVEHKMGIKGCATCTLEFVSSTGWLVGELHGGLPAMFSMMNTSRLAAAVQAVGLSEIAFQSALRYARERLQGRAVGAAPPTAALADPIIRHADVRKSLLTMKAWTEGIRALVLWSALHREWAGRAPDPSVRQRADDLLQLLTPVAKALASDVAFEVANLAVQIHGGHGYIRDHGVEQLVRDARVIQLYEGTNGIQALDLVNRKVRAHDGRYVHALFAVLQEFTDEHDGDQQLQEFCQPLANATAHLKEAMRAVHAQSESRPEAAGAVATELLRLLGLVTLGFLWARMAQIACVREAGDRSGFYRAKIETARFYLQKMLPQSAALLASINAGSDSIMRMDEALFDAGRT